MKGRVVWTEGICSNYWFHMKQNHMLLSIWCAHDQHPYSRCERLSNLISGACAGLGVSYLLADPDTGHRKEGFYNTFAYLCVSVYMTIDASVKTYAATCAMCQKGSCCSCCKNNAESCGRWVMAVSWINSLIWLGVG